MKRILTALLLIPLIVWLVLFAPQWAFLIALAAIGAIAFYEFSQIVQQNGIPAPGWPGMIAGVAVMLAPQPWVVLVLVAIFALLISLRARDLARALPRAAAFLLGAIYIFGAWRCAVELRAIDANWLMFALLLSWAGDTAALYVGKAFGRHALAPRVSPAKTWEGAAGSVAGGILAGFVYAHYLIPSAPVAVVLLLAATGNIAGQLGDLCESAIKRGAGVKDSGNTLPGHGGWLDRIDSSLFSVPVVFAILNFIPR
ncbi:MAG TPA: phosphatidate cytidylyltransferase [Bryobacteraceae bacterium]|jgi:phosphatidate cytidylyltransferase|nr:phosphatidate cytidylyltransferase [Bryobacteraceae bacterium]